MKLIRFGPNGHEKPGIIGQNEKRLDLSSFGEDYDEAFFGSNGIDRLSEWLTTNESSCPEVSADQRWGAPIQRPSKIVCVGLNYAPHAEESKMNLPKEPILFFKATSALCGPFDQVQLPAGATKVDWEVELAVVIGKKTKNISEAQALDHIVGYSILNDVSERHFQLERGGQWVKGKSADTFAPMGPYLATKEEVPDPHKLDIWLKVNGETRQNSSTSHLIFNIPHLVSYISGFMTLLPGDIISTGTPSGVGLGFDPPVYLQSGDKMELGVEGLGISRQEVVG